MRVDFPHPEGPTKAIFEPLLMSRLSSFRTRSYVELYLKERFWIEKFPSMGFVSIFEPLFICS